MITAAKASAWKEYEAATALAQDAYEAAAAPAWKEYEKAIALAQEAYGRQGEVK